MSIAAKCTCGCSLTGVCTSSVEECNQLINMENNTQLPIEVVDKIEQEAHDATCALYSPNNYDEFTSFRSGWEKGATAYASKLHQVEQENAELRRQNDKLKQQAEGWRPLLEEVLKNDATFGKLPIKLIDKITKFLYGE